jgi:hypothetical protein
VIHYGFIDYVRARGSVKEKGALVP